MNRKEKWEFWSAELKVAMPHYFAEVSKIQSKIYPFCKTQKGMKMLAKLPLSDLPYGLTV